MKDENIKLEDIMHAIKSRWFLIVGVTLITTALATALSLYGIEPKYQASTKLFVGKEVSQESVDGNYDSNEVQMYQKLLKTYSDVILTKDLVGKSLANRNIDLKVDNVLSNLNVVPKPDTQIMVISYVSTDKQKTRDVVAAVTDEFIKTSKELISNVSVKVVETVTLPENPISPNKKVNIAVGFMLGLMISVGISILLEFMDNTFKNKEQIENLLKTSTLGTIPNFERKR
ncbi:Wzz/FepE/Etk N-terminal domain-containing protein [Clostridium sp. SHJSY1]|uniref:YveK family protein n=1 Tax=Clostridium sp. SHJSY1 TaxID=2942483 RepID=UPI00287659FE|nr:Wzz/FepE/Etk N-terminal domain-containing protein [Clostridium sp. SHJSY1]MDS0526645.1 Wzz/FepE/Etk N-terminal domain-containing protein [Clostridium sp. SHJSY1]